MMKTRVRVEKEIPKVKVLGREAGPFEVGEEADLPHWHARALLKRGEGVATFLSSADLRRKIVAEETQQDLSPLPPDFFWNIRESILALRTTGREKEAEELKTLAIKLADIRALKLLRLAVDPESARTQVPEERFLLNLMGNLLDFWMKDLAKFLELGGEVKSIDQARSV